VGALWICGSYGIVEFVGWCIIGLVIESQDDYRDVGQSQCCNAL